MKLKMKSWEYLVIDDISNDKLNELGINGWKLVSVIFIERSPIPPMFRFYFKKQVLSNKD